MSYTAELACEKDPELFFSGSAGHQAKAKRLCLGCAIAPACLQNCLEYESASGTTMHGVRGGTTQLERQRAAEIRRSA